MQLLFSFPMYGIVTYVAECNKIFFYIFAFLGMRFYMVKFQVPWIRGVPHRMIPTTMDFLTGVFITHLPYQVSYDHEQATVYLAQGHNSRLLIPVYR